MLSEKVLTSFCFKNKNPETYVPGPQIKANNLPHGRTVCRPAVSSLIQTLLSVLEFHQISRCCINRSVFAISTVADIETSSPSCLSGSRTIPPVGNHTQPRRTFSDIKIYDHAVIPLTVTSIHHVRLYRKRNFSCRVYPALTVIAQSVTFTLIPVPSYQGTNPHKSRLSPSLRRYTAPVLSDDRNHTP